MLRPVFYLFINNEVIQILARRVFKYLHLKIIVLNTLVHFYAIKGASCSDTNFFFFKREPLFFVVTLCIKDNSHCFYFN